MIVEDIYRTVDGDTMVAIKSNQHSWMFKLDDIPLYFMPRFITSINISNDIMNIFID